MKKNPRLVALFFYFLVFFISHFIFLSCATNAAAFENFPADGDKSLFLPSESEISWQKIENLDCAQYFLFENKAYPVRYHCVKINLAAENVSIVAYPESKDDFVHKKGQKTEILNGITAKKFSDKSNSLVAVNMTPFENLSFFSSKRKICGILVANRKMLSLPVERYAAVVFFKDSLGGYTAKILKNQKNEDFGNYDFAFGGFFQILSDGKKEEFRVKSNNSRLALALSEDGKTIYLLAVEGERKKQSRGLSFQECAEIFLFLGAKNAIQMDGGGSASLFIDGKNILSYNTLRKNAVFLGFSLTTKPL